MQKISIVPDTNVFIYHLDFIYRLLNVDLPIYLSINVSQAVIEELDKLKKEQENANNATKLILKDQTNRIEIEGHKDNRRVEVEIKFKGEINIKNNDDRVLNYAMKLENPVILTRDQLFIVKCKTQNVGVVNMLEEDENKAFNSILGLYGLNISLINEDVYNKVEILRCKLLPVIKEILFKELGQNYVILLEKEDILFIISLIIDNFFLFKNYLPKSSKSLLLKFKQALVSSKIDEINRKIPLIYSLFRIK